ncbi:Bacillibactin transport regulator [Serratia plymuthica]|uniref:helix-turn-helix transcriptional regulator n=2 Tax=Serratia TaxID=613 RepID=UPI00217B391A|nr:AraC family transcriptional regulator [Serratia plymuthica]CAI1171721.1 Bacillibactin transport regulator [Serratia plymuthica]
MMNSTNMHKHDRLAAFLRAFDLKARVLSGPTDPANLYVAAREVGEGASHIRFNVAGGPPPEGEFAVIVSAGVDFSGELNPLVGTLPDRMDFLLADTPALQGVADLFIGEAQSPRCGTVSVQDRLCEVIIVLVIRRAIAAGAVKAGMLAGLAHPALHRSLVAMHDEPACKWSVERLAQIAGMSRSHFIERFGTVVGETPGAYLTAWRLTLGRKALMSGRSVKQVAYQVGFGSVEAFSRAFSAKYGVPPSSVKKGMGLQ